MTLRVIEGGSTKEPWHQRDDEDETSFSLFAGWLNTPQPRKLPDYPQIAMQYGWAERANAHDMAHSLPTTPRGQLERMLSDALTIGALEMRKLMSRVREDGTSVLTTKEVVMFMHALVENRPALEKALEQDTGENLEGLSDDELEAVLKAKQALSRAGISGKK
jgi:hypothetical protein